MPFPDNTLGLGADVGQRFVASHDVDSVRLSEELSP